MDLIEEEVIKHFEMLLNETSYSIVVFDRIHDLAQYCSVKQNHRYLQLLWLQSRKLHGSLGQPPPSDS